MDCSQLPQVGRYTAKRLAFRRRLTMESLDAIPRAHAMLALLELDVSDTLDTVEDLRARGVRVSLFAFIAKCIATALTEHPAFNAIRGGSKIYTFEDVDLNIPVELSAKAGAAPHLLVVRRANEKSIEVIYAEVEAARRELSQRAAVGREDRRVQRLMRFFVWLPKWMRRWALGWMAGHPLMVKQLTGTTFLTSVAKFVELRGFVVPYVAGPVATSFTIGGVSHRVLARDGQPVVRRCLSMTVAFNHDLVDGGPAARFTTRLAQLIEHPSLLGLPPQQRRETEQRARHAERAESQREVQEQRQKLAELDVQREQAVHAAEQARAELISHAKAESIARERRTEAAVAARKGLAVVEPIAVTPTRIDPRALKVLQATQEQAINPELLKALQPE